MTKNPSIATTSDIFSFDDHRPKEPLLEIEIIDLEDPLEDGADNVVFYRTTCTTCSTS